MDTTNELMWFTIEIHFYTLVNCVALVVLLTSARCPGYNIAANLFVAIIAILEFRIILVLDVFSVIDIKGPRLCGAQAFTKKFLIGTVPLTLCGISYERLRSLPRIHEVRSVFPTWKVVLFTWGVSALLSSSRFLAYEYHTSSYNGNITSDTPSGSHSMRSHNDNNDTYIVYSKSVCRKTPILGSIWINGLHECVICGLLHVSPALYNIYDLHKIRFKASYICLSKKLKATIGSKLYRKLKRIQLAFLYTTIFALIWIPYGLVTVLRSFTENSRAVVVNYNVKGRSPEKTLQTWFENLFATFHPIFYLYTHHHSRFISFLRMCRRKLRGQQNTRSEEVRAISTIAMETFEVSGYMKLKKR